jgi:hypothetical protein
VKIERLTKDLGEAIAIRLQDRRDLDGTFLLVQRPEDPTRYFITPAAGASGEFRAMVGLDGERGRITLLLNSTEAVAMLGATTAPL